MNIIKKLTVAATLLFVVTQFACNKPDAASIVVGTYSFVPSTSYIKYDYAIVADTLQVFNPKPSFFNAPFPTVEISKNTTQQVSFKQNVPNETLTFSKVNLYLDAGGTLLKGEVEDGKFIDGKFIGYSFAYDVFDTVNKKVIRVKGVDTKR